jgi:hypothetical protein
MNDPYKKLIYKLLPHLLSTLLVIEPTARKKIDIGQNQESSSAYM